METQDRTKVNKVVDAIAASQKHLLSIQNPDGYWWAELESNVTITSEAVLLHKIWGTDKTRPLHKVENYLRSQQREHGGWELFYGDGGDLSTTVEAYMALRLLGVSPTDPALLKAKSLILAKGGISKTRIFTKLHLALIGCYNWRGLPSLPPWVMLLPDNFFFNIYELSSWARSSTVPLLIVFDQKPVFKIDQPINLDELYAEGVNNVRWKLPKNGDWSDIFNILDDGFKLAESLNFVPFRNEGIKAAENWILERQEVTGDWGGIIPAMLNSLLALKCLDYDANDPIIERGLKAVDNFAIEIENSYCVQPCVSPVWDTAWAIRALIDSGFAPNNAPIVKAGEWLIEKQILDYGDWNVKNKQGKPGAWAFEFENRFYPDVDDSAVVVMALHQAKLPHEELKKQAINRALNWIATMQCKPGGWAAFDIDNDQEWLNAVPYGDLKAMIDPNTADVTARVLEMLGACNLSIQPNNLEKSLDYLLKEQETEGCWFGRWGVNYIYGTSGVLSALALINPLKYAGNINQGVNWLVKVQNSDGGWGETCFSYNDPNLKGKGDSTASQTAWALIGLIAAGEATGKLALDSIEKGINYLLETQKSDGTWDEIYFTGTGFPCHFYLKYHLYQQYFPLMALGRYQAIR
ncbi:MULTISPECIES: squalene--hopene cyclase [Aphanizomenon]|uniref:squalene--hopene cyclase n=1 Tax=Aphanizomenon TaxID=1175 RepID=UPI000542C757|nr:MULTISPECIES: squalene--hopene cyclase [Aphanizomenon]KHG39760.1 squalene cyclase [Aphanizomenon flos-aquae 2012/KM1/D3]MTJ32871.1 squalene--hopene cyclase [Aphanizomenon sp. UHCC 0183]QSV73731.1 MAG: squalene--hopene cyclase [Aphanizomenon flos-aquae KM1D3_PB]